MRHDRSAWCCCVLSMQTPGLPPTDSGGLGACVWQGNDGVAEIAFPNHMPAFRSAAVPHISAMRRVGLCGTVYASVAFRANLQCN